MHEQTTLFELRIALFTLVLFTQNSSFVQRTCRHANLPAWPWHAVFCQVRLPSEKSSPHMVKALGQRFNASSDYFQTPLARYCSLLPIRFQ